MKSWRSTLIGPNTTLQDAIATLDSAGLRIVMVVDEARRLLGILTDGDVRRALLRYVALSAPVTDAMVRSPHTADTSWGRERMLTLMEQHQLLQIPVLDTDGQVVGLETLHGLIQKQKVRRDNPVFLMAGGFGKRLQPLTNNCPKPLLKVGEKPILEIILENFISYGFYRFFISTHYMPEMIREYFGDGSRWGVNIRYIHEDQPLGTGGALGLLPHDEIDLPMFMMNGDLLTNLDLLKFLDFHQKNTAISTMCVREYEHCVPYGVIQNDGHRIVSMIEKPTHRFFINAGIYLLSPEVVKSVVRGTRIDMPTLLENEISRGADVNMFPVYEYWLDIGRMEDFERAQREICSLGGNTYAKY